MNDIFLSYKSEDRARAKIIAETIEQYGYSIWWDQIIPPGKAFDQVIKEKIDAAKCVVVLWSKMSVESDWVKEEANEGLRRRILIPILIDNVEIPLGFKRFQAANLINWQGALHNHDFDLLLKSIGEILGKSPAPKIQPINDHNLSAQQLYEQGKYSKAIDKWKEVLKLDSKNKIAIEGINNALLLRRQREENTERERKAEEKADETYENDWSNMP